MSDGDQARRGSRRPRAVAVGVVFWLAAVAVQLVLFGALGGDTVGENDDFSRLAQVADLRDGQGWYDLTQYRLNPPSGTSMHWTRHVDVLYLGVESAFGGPGDGAQRAAVIVLPLALLLGVYVAVAAIGERLSGREAIPAVLLLLLASVFATIQFRPGRIDHHGLQIVLLLVAVAGLLRLEDRRWAIITGVAAGVSLSIGLELLGSVGAVVLAAGLVAAARGPRILSSVRWFAGSLVGSAVVSAVLFAPPSRLFGRDCDVLSLPYIVSLLVASGAVVGAASLADHHGYGRRLATVVGGGAIGAVLGIAVAPACIGGPYADVDPFLSDFWLRNVGEARSLFGLLEASPGAGWAILVPGLAAIAAAIVLAKRESDPGGMWMRVVPVLVLSFGVAIVQVRGAGAATALAAAVLGVVVFQLRHRLLERVLVARVAAVFALVIFLSGLAPGVVAVLISPPAESAADCGDDVEVLEDLAPAVILGPIDLGPSVLAFTDHSVVAGPYHRNNVGNLAAWRFFLAAPDEAAERLDQVGAALVAVCPGLPESSLLEELAPDGVLALIVAGGIPPGLEALDLETEHLLVFRRASA